MTTRAPAVLKIWWNIHEGFRWRLISNISLQWSEVHTVTPPQNSPLNSTQQSLFVNSHQWSFCIVSKICFRFCGFCSNRILHYFPLFMCPCTGVTSHISHIYKGINAMVTIRGPIKPYIFWIKSILAIFLAKTRPDKTIFSALTNLTIDFDFELSKV